MSHAPDGPGWDHGHVAGWPGLSLFLMFVQSCENHAESSTAYGLHGACHQCWRAHAKKQSMVLHEF